MLGESYIKMKEQSFLKKKIPVFEKAYLQKHEGAQDDCGSGGSF